MTLEPAHHGNTRIFPASLDPRAVDVVTRLTRAGYESYLVGGCVRDLLLGHIPKDFDVSTEARPRQIRRVFRNCRIIGRRFKLAHVHFGDTIIEVATFRRNPSEKSADDGVGEGDDDGEVDNDDLLITRDNEFGNAEEDSIRRDFTINALLYDVAENAVIDYVGGFEDIEQRVLRTIGEPAIRLAEDPVRMLRAVKFTARLGLTVDPALDQAMHDCAELIDKSAPARVIEEIFKLLTCGRAEVSLKLLLDYGLLGRLMPEVADHWQAHPERLVDYGRALDLLDGGKRRVSNALLLAALFHDPWMAAIEADEDADPLQTAADLIGPAAQRTSIPRRDVARLKQLLVTQLRLARNRRGRRFRMSDFLARASTVEAIDLLHMRARVGGVDPEQHAEWAERLALRLGEDQQGPGGSAAGAADDDEFGDDERPARRKRRRGGRRRRRRRSGDERDEPHTAGDSDGEADDSGRSATADAGDDSNQDDAADKPRRSRSRRGGRSRGRRDGEQPDAPSQGADTPRDEDSAAGQASGGEAPTDGDTSSSGGSPPAASPRRRRVPAADDSAPSRPLRRPAPASEERSPETAKADVAAAPASTESTSKRGLGGLVRRLFRKVLSPEESAPDPAQLTTPTPPAARQRRLPDARPLSSQDGPPVVGPDELEEADDVTSAPGDAEPADTEREVSSAHQAEGQAAQASATGNGDSDGDEDTGDDGEPRPRKRRRRRRRRRSGSAPQADGSTAGDSPRTSDDDSDTQDDDSPGEGSSDDRRSESKARPARSRRRGSRRRGGAAEARSDDQKQDGERDDGRGSSGSRRRGRGGSSAASKSGSRSGGQRSSSRSGRSGGGRKRSDDGDRPSSPAPQPDGLGPPRQAEDVEDLFDW